MKKYWFTLGCMLWLSGYAMAQCENCPTNSLLVADYCFTHTQFKGYCAQFSAEKGQFVLQGGRKPRFLPVSTEPSIEYLLSLAADKKLKLEPSEILFVERAISQWQIESRKFGYEYQPSGLGLKILHEGEGDLPEMGKEVTVHYTGYLEDGTKFDSSKDRDKPFTFTLGAGQVIKGWDEGIGLLRKGTKAFLRIPPQIGYGSTARGPIPANAVLYFEVELLQD